MRRQYEVAQKQQEVDELTKEQGFYKARGIAFGVIVLLTVTLAGVQLYHSRRRKRINQLLRNQQKQLEQLNETKDKFFSIISHDLRSPIATFQNFTEVFDVLVDNKEYDNLKQVSVQMKQSSAGIMDLVDNLFSWGLNQKGEIPFQPKMINLHETVQTLMSVLGDMAAVKGITLNKQIDETIELVADQQMLQAIIRNLINNALKFTFKGGTVTLKAKQANAAVVIIVSDTGIGIHPDKIKSLFELDASKSTFGTQNEKGVGLGLRLVYEFVERHNGIIRVKSVVGEGTDMIVEIPS
ncbi:sensor histidine kinase [Carboxylicivirga sp. N1Y90]|uniref:sensor histidine kinase n=1 Tax=Carboxylicivirga fragile TaxID=3417571 RepID=UPI003D354D1A|nr:HAMP domain-containing histidine kinase [Marinilabiliaceae bacterium N1Y90]